MDAQMQCGSANCGIFAIAFATNLANGEKSGGVIIMTNHVAKALDALFSNAVSFSFSSYTEK